MRFQFTDYDCGPVAIGNAIRCLGFETEIGDLMGVARPHFVHGTNERNMVRTIREFGFTAREYHSSDFPRAFVWLRRTLDSGKPVILCVDEWDHWVVAAGRLRDSVIVLDSELRDDNIEAGGIHLLDYDELCERWWNDRDDVDDEMEYRMYAIAVGRGKKR